MLKRHQWIFFLISLLIAASIFVGLSSSRLDPMEEMDRRSGYRIFVVGDALARYCRENKLPTSSGLSWRVHILPFLGEEQLFREFNLNEPWDSNHNRALISKMPVVYAPSRQGNGVEKYSSGSRTCLLAVEGTVKTISQSEASKNPELSGHVMLVEVQDENSVVWTKPDDFFTDRSNPLVGLRIHFSDHFYAIAIDGSGLVVPTNLDLKSYGELFLCNGKGYKTIPKIRKYRYGTEDEVGIRPKTTSTK